MATFVLFCFLGGGFVRFITQRPFSPGEEEQGSMAEVSYYSYEYDPDLGPFLADTDGGDQSDFPDRGGEIEQKLFLPTDIQPPTLDTKNTPERWYDSRGPRRLVVNRPHI